MESPSDTDLEMQANRLQEQEWDLNDYIQVNKEIRPMNGNLSHTHFQDILDTYFFVQMFVF